LLKSFEIDMSIEKCLLQQLAVTMMIEDSQTMLSEIHGKD